MQKTKLGLRVTMRMARAETTQQQPSLTAPRRGEQSRSSDENQGQLGSWASSWWQGRSEGKLGSLSVGCGSCPDPHDPRMKAQLQSSCGVEEGKPVLML